MNKSNDFMYYVGIDVSKKHLDACIMKDEAVIFEARFDNNKKGWISFVKSASTNVKFDPKITLFCLENTGMYSNPTLYFLHQKNFSVWLESPMQIKRSQGITRGKSDLIDAKRIAQYASMFQRKFKLWTPAKTPILKLKRLYAFREKIKRNLGQYLSPAADSDFMDDKEVKKIQQKISKSIINMLRNKLELVETEIKSIIEENQELKKLFRIVQSVDGIGFVSALDIIVNTEAFERISCPKKYACYCGIAPFEHSSGSSVRGRTRVSHLANKRAKSVLHLAAMSSVYMKGELQDYYQRKVLEGKSKLCALNAVRNKLIYRVFACVKREEEYVKVRA